MTETITMKFFRKGKQGIFYYEATAPANEVPSNWYDEEGNLKEIIEIKRKSNKWYKWDKS